MKVALAGLEDFFFFFSPPISLSLVLNTRREKTFIYGIITANTYRLCLYLYFVLMWFRIANHSLLLDSYLPTSLS